MKQYNVTGMRRMMKKWLLPMVAVVLIVCALIVIAVVPGDRSKEGQDILRNETTEQRIAENTKEQITEAGDTDRTEEGTDAAVYADETGTKEDGTDAAVYPDEIGTKEGNTEDTVYTDEISSEGFSTEEEKTSSTDGSKTDDGYARLNENGDVIIYADDLSTDTVSYIRYSEDSRIELLAVKGEDGMPKVALGTCQSCNGSPYAYYVQSGNEFQCNNCGLTFPLSEIGVDGNGCHPIKISDSGIRTTEDGIVISKDLLMDSESLFLTVEEH